MGNKIQLILIVIVGVLVVTNIFTYTKVTALGKEVTVLGKEVTVLGKETYEHNLYSEAGHSHNYMYSSQNHTHSNTYHSHDFYASSSHQHDEYATQRDLSGLYSILK